MLAAIAEVWRHLTQKNWAGGLTSCNEESGNGPSLGCAVLEENGHTKRERRGFRYIFPHTFPGHFCPVTEAKGKKW